MSKATAFYQYGLDAAQKGNTDYAIQMFRDACRLSPENLEYRKALRAVQRRKFGNEPGKVGRLVGARLQPLRMKIRGARGKEQWQAVLEACEEAFEHSPWDAHTARDAADAAYALGYKDVAQWLIESVMTATNDPDYFRHAAELFEKCESYHKAISCWEKVKKLVDNDEFASHAINSLAAKATIARSGMGAAIQKHQSPKMEELADDLEDLKQNAISPEERLTREIAEHPERVGSYLELAEMYKLRGQLEEAERLLARGLKAVPNDESLKQAHAEVQINRLRHAVEKWHRKLREKPHDETAKAKVAQLEEMLSDYEIKEFRRRLDMRPDDMNLQYQVGLRLAARGRHDEAIAAFQQSRNSPLLKVQSLHQAGLSFEANGVLKLAERSYQEALRNIEDGDTALLNALHYRLGRVAEAMGNLSVAEEHYNEVAANDYGYLDVAQRLKGLV